MTSAARSSAARFRWRCHSPSKPSPLLSRTRERKRKTESRSNPPPTSRPLRAPLDVELGHRARAGAVGVLEHRHIGLLLARLMGGLRRVLRGLGRRSALRSQCGICISPPQGSSCRSDICGSFRSWQMPTPATAANLCAQPAPSARPSAAGASRGTARSSAAAARRCPSRGSRRSGGRGRARRARRRGSARRPLRDPPRASPRRSAAMRSRRCAVAVGVDRYSASSASTSSTTTP